MERIDLHLNECPACREFYEGNDDLAQVLTRGNEIAHPGDDYLSQLSSRILENLSAPAKSSGRRDDERIDAIMVSGHPGFRPLWVGGGLAAAALLIAGLMPVTPAPDKQMAGSAPSPTPFEVMPQIVSLSISPQATYVSESLPQAGLTAVAINHGASQGVMQGGTASLSKSVRDAEEAVRHDQHRTEDPRARMLALIIEPGPAQPPVPEKFKPARDPIRPKTDWIERVIRAETTGQGREEVYTAIRAERQALGPKVARDSIAQARALDQCLRYGEAEQAFREGRNETAREHYEAVMQLHPASPLACKAALKMADYHFDVAGDFGKAMTLYKLCGNVSGVFSPVESDHIRVQLSILSRYAANEWTSLRLLQVLRQGTWEGAAAALIQIEGDPAEESIRGEAGRIIAERVRQGGRIPKAQIKSLTETLLHGAESSGEINAKAWMTLAAAEILWTQYESSEASKLYSRVVQLQTRSAADGMARTRLKEIGTRVIEGMDR